METEILIRPFQNEDAESFYRNVACDPVFLEMSGLSQDTGLREIREYIEQRIAVAGRAHFYDYAIVLPEENEVIGEINAAYIPHGIADAGHVIAKAYRGRGYGTLALQMLMEILREDGISIVYAACRKNNPASMRVMENAE